MDPLVAEAMKKAPIAWLAVDDRPPYAVWCLWLDDALLVVSGADEQPAPGLAGAARATVSARGDHGGRIVSWAASVERINPDSALWGPAALALAGKRLNSVAAEELVTRWARDGVISRLVPTDEEPLALPAGSLAAPPAPSPAVRLTRKPFRLHRVRRPKR